MFRLLILILSFSEFACGQPAFKPSKDEQTKAYSQVIAEYIKAVSQTDTLHYDTLFIADHQDLPQIQWPETIESKKIILLNHEKSDKQHEHNPSFVLINIAEQTFTNDSVGFILVTFHKGYQPQHNCYIDLKYNSTKENYELDKKIKFEYPQSRGLNPV